jgi:SAM-dependent methyltransferase
MTDTPIDLLSHNRAAWNREVSNVFIDDVLPVWREAYRVLRPGGSLLSGFVNPVVYMLDWDAVEAGRPLELWHAISYADPESLPPEVKQMYLDGPIPFEFGYALGDLIGGQIAAGFVITGFYEDKGEPTLDLLIDPFISTRAEKP